MNFQPNTSASGQLDDVLKETTKLSSVPAFSTLDNLDTVSLGDTLDTFETTF